MSGFKHDYGYFLLALFAFISWTLVNLAEVDGTSTRLIPPHSPDIFGAGYIKWQMDTAGLANTQVVADKIAHYSDDRTTHLEKPLLVFNQKKGPPWEIQSESGTVSADGKNVLLVGKTRIERQQAGPFRALRITTSNLKVQPENHYAETDDWAELVSLPNKTTGTGMKLVFKPPIHIELMAHVQGKYETQP